MPAGAERRRAAAYHRRALLIAGGCRLRRARSHARSGYGTGLQRGGASRRCGKQQCPAPSPLGGASTLRCRSAPPQGSPGRAAAAPAGRWRERNRLRALRLRRCAGVVRLKMVLYFSPCWALSKRYISCSPVRVLIFLHVHDGGVEHPAHEQNNQEVDDRERGRGPQILLADRHSRE